MEFQLMERTRIVPSPLNPRKHFDEAKLRELAGTMGNGVGIIEPLVVRPRPELNCYELVAGERRWRAAAIAGLDDVPVMVKNLTDAQMLEIMVIENNAREDVSALEEAAGFKQLLALGNFDVDGLAKRLGRSRKYVYDRVKLLSVVPAGQKLLAEGRITAGHAILLARLTPEQQTVALDPDSRGVWAYDADDDESSVDSGDPFFGYIARSVRDFERWIVDNCRFQPTAPENIELFPETATAFVNAEKVVHVTHRWQVTSHAQDEDKQHIYVGGTWKRADGAKGSAPCAHAVLGVVVIGEGRGEAFKVCVHQKECDTHWLEERKERERQAKARATQAPASRTAASNPSNDAFAKRQREVEEKRKVWAAAVPDLIAACAGRVKALKVDRLADLIVDSEGFEPDACDTAEQALAVKKKDADAVLRVLALAACIGRLGNPFWSPDSFPAYAKKELGLDVDGVLKKHAQTSAPPSPAKKKTAAKATKTKPVATAKAVAKKSAKKSKAA